MIRRSILPLLILVFAVIAAMTPRVVYAYPELEIAPLLYTANLKLGEPQVGILDISNPTGAPATITLQVEAFRQVDNTGRLEYYADERVASGIVPAQTSFSLGPREALRTKFTIDPNKLGSGGTYGVIFAQTQADDQGASQINTATRVGTLIILDVAGQGTSRGQISKNHLVNVGNGHLQGSLSYTNLGTGDTSLAFTPNLSVKIGNDKPQLITGPFVFPGRTRDIRYSVNLGSHIGYTKILYLDATGSSKPVTAYCWLLTGTWIWLLPLYCFGILCTAFIIRCRSKITRQIRRSFTPVKRLRLPKKFPPGRQKTEPAPTEVLTDETKPEDNPGAPQRKKRPRSAKTLVQSEKKDSAKQTVTKPKLPKKPIKKPPENPKNS
jgi:hypothetical protein